MDLKVTQKKTGKETLSGREVVFTYEHNDGEKPKEIDVKAQTVKDGKTETITGTYTFASGDLRLQVFNISLGEVGPVATGIEKVISEIVESFNTEK